MQTNLPSSGILRRQNDRDRDRDPDRDRDSGRQADRDNGRDRQNDNGRDRDGGNNNANVNVNNNDNGRNGANRVDNNNRGSGLGNAAALLAANNAANRINPLAAAAALRPPLRPLPGNFGGPGLGTPAGLGLGGIGGIGANDGLRPLPGFSVPPPGASLVPLPGAASSPVVDPAVAAPPPVAVPGAAAGDAGSVQPGLASGGQGVAVVPLTTPAAVAATPAVATPPAAAPTVGGPSVFASDVPPVLVSPDPLPTTVLQQPPVDTLAPVPVPTMAVPVDIPPVAIPADLGPGGVPGGTQTTDMSPLFSPATGMPASSDGPASLSAGAAAGIALGSIAVVALLSAVAFAFLRRSKAFSSRRLNVSWLRRRPADSGQDPEAMAEKQRSMLSVASTAWEVETAPAPAAPLPREDKAGPKRAPVKLPRQDRTATTEAVGRSAPSRPLVPLSSSTKLADTTPEQAAQVATAIRTKKVEVAKIEIAKTAKVKPDKRVT